MKSNSWLWVERIKVQEGGKEGSCKTEEESTAQKEAGGGAEGPAAERQLPEAENLQGSWPWKEDSWGTERKGVSPSDCSYLQDCDEDRSQEMTDLGTRDGQGFSGLETKKLMETFF